jgi:hypothetical protein
MIKITEFDVILAGIKGNALPLRHKTNPPLNP